MRFRSQNRHVIDFIFPLAVFFVFAASSFAVLVLSANIYNTQTKEIMLPAPPLPMSMRRYARMMKEAACPSSL